MVAAAPFGSCCENLRQAMHSKTNSTFQLEGDVLFLIIGIVPMQNQTGYFSKPIRFCPFCGSELQTADQIAAWDQKQ